MKALASQGENCGKKILVCHQEWSYLHASTYVNSHKGPVYWQFHSYAPSRCQRCPIFPFRQFCHLLFQAWGEIMTMKNGEVYVASFLTQYNDDWRKKCCALNKTCLSLCCSLVNHKPYQNWPLPILNHWKVANVSYLHKTSSREWDWAFGRVG